MAKKKVKPNSKITEAKYPIFPNRTKKKKVSKSSNNIKLSIAPWIAGELKIRGLTKDEKEFFEVISIQKEGQNLVRLFGTQKGADRFYNKISLLQSRSRQREKEKGILVSSYTTVKTHKNKGHKGCRVCGRPPLMGEDFCSDHI